MKYFISFLITILLHYLIYTYLIQKDKIIPSANKITQTKQKTTIQYVKLKKKTKQTPKKISSKIKDTKKFKNYIKPKKKKESPVKKKVPITKEIKKYKKATLKKKIVKQSKIKNNLKSDIIDSFYEKKEVQKEPKKEIKKKQPKLDSKTQSFVDLYGKEFDDLEQKTKLYLINNLAHIGKITQRFLEYPTMSIQANQSGKNVVEFILNENGTIDNLKILSTSGYFLLDDNTLETIEEAYSDYPRPSKPTQIKIYVKYILTN